MDKSNAYQNKGTWDVRRHLKIPSLQHKADTLSVIAVVDTLPGVRQAEVDLSHYRLKLLYDSSQVDFQRVKTDLEASGYPTAADRWSRLREQWYRFVDSNMRENSHAPPPVCCSKPPKWR